ncbi:tetratricopeptide repeat protein [Streptomyces sp. 110]|uniref:Tetratricopeptide repeat protein n=1 Tax=Streptomyces endocoffeicus TaxID=2898945 RepID=A0ABS1PTJ9_9ACTN|nr:tetratricopeptide repeat protein [Streptomyces endocoffeicus]MBL1115300.1 tetratricopeptide repeat protein [Streptomyces endocoffeicus]
MASDTQSLTVISGPPGVGKTALALSWLYRHSDDFPDGELYVDLEGHRTDNLIAPSTVLPRFLHALGTEPDHVPADLAEQTALFRTVTAGRRIAVLCDNAKSAAQVRPLIPASAGGVCVVTSRWQLAPLLLDGATMASLEPLTTDSAVELLGRIAGQGRVAADETAARKLVMSCGRFPLAVCVEAALLATRPERSITSVVAGLLATLPSATPDEEVSMNACLDQSYDALLDDDARQLYRRIGLHPGSEFSTDTAEAIAAAHPPVHDVTYLLATLVDASLLTTAAPDRYRFHDLIQDHARSRAQRDDTAEQRADIVRRIVEHYLAVADAADRVLYPLRRRPEPVYAGPPPYVEPFTAPRAALARLDSERTNLLPVQRLAAESALHRAVWQLADAYWALFIYRPYHQDWISSHQLGLDGARADNHLLGEARLSNGLGVALREAGQCEEALRVFEDAQALRRRLGDRRGEALVLHHTGLAHRDLGDLGQASKALRTALALREETGDTRGIARGLSALGEVESLAGRHEQAITCLSKAREMIKGTGDRTVEPLIERLLGQAHLRAGDLTNARVHLSSALDALSDMDDVAEEGTTLEALAELAQEEDDAAAAQDFHARARAIYGRTRRADRREMTGE